MLDALISRVNNLTSGYGEKASLARHLGVTRQQLNAWLSGDREPSGGVALHLKEWADLREKKHSAPARATNTRRSERPANQTLSHEKFTGPPKRGK